MDEGTPAGRLAFHGHAALRRLGIRVTWMYLAAGALALVVEAIGGPPPTPARWFGLLGLLVLLAATGRAVVVACLRPRSRLWTTMALLVNTAAGIGVVVQVAGDPGWSSAALLATTVATGAAVGLALGLGPGWGVLAAGLGTAGICAAGAAVGAPIGPLAVLGLPTSAVVAACIAMLTGRGFADTEAALRGVDQALAMERVAAARWQAGRRADREVHDTVLTTLTVLAHDQFGFDPEPVRELCRRDLAFVSRD